MDIKTNLLNMWENVASIEGWKILKKGPLLALRSPFKMSAINFTWGVRNTDDIHIVKDFYQDYPFIVSSEFDLQPILENSTQFSFITKFPEMHLDLSSYTPEIDCHPKIEVKTVKDIKDWATIASTVFNLDSESVSKILTNLLTLKHSYALLGSYNGQPAGTAYLYIDNNDFVGIYFMAVVEEFRRLRIGKSIMQQCIKLAVEQKAKRAGLYSSSMGHYLYEEMEFKDITYFFEYESKD